MNRTLTTIIVIVVILLIGWWLFSLGTDRGMGPNGVGTTTPTSTATGTTPLQTEANAVFVEDQPAGNRVVVRTVVLERGGFVALHRSVGGQAGEVVGVSSYLPSGTSSNISVNLTRQVANGSALIAMLHQDNGDRSFAEATDPSVTSRVSGSPIMMTFMLRANTTPSATSTL